MKVKDITIDSKDVEVEAKVAEVGDIRLVNTRFGQKEVCTAVIEDETGQINLSVWEDDTKKLEVGKTLIVKGAYVTEFQNKLQLNLARASTIEVK
jgi:replication factor A1